jgi:hypothetical protein
VQQREVLACSRQVLHNYSTHQEVPCPGATPLSDGCRASYTGIGIKQANEPRKCNHSVRAGPVCCHNAHARMEHEFPLLQHQARTEPRLAAAPARLWHFRRMLRSAAPDRGVDADDDAAVQALDSIRATLSEYRSLQSALRPWVVQQLELTGRRPTLQDADQSGIAWVQVSCVARGPAPGTTAPVKHHRPYQAPLPLSIASNSPGDFGAVTEQGVATLPCLALSSASARCCCWGQLYPPSVAWWAQLRMITAGYHGALRARPREPLSSLHPRESVWRA